MPDSNPVRDAGLRFARRVYPMRALGLGLGTFCIAGVLHENGTSPWVWGVLFLNGWVWPHVAFRLARANPDPARAEARNLMVDSACGGAWIAVMQLNLLPSVLLLTMLSIDKVAAGGWPMLFRSWAFMGLAFFVAWIAFGLPLQPHTTQPVMLASLPFLVSYPLGLSWVTHHLGQHVARQNRRLEDHSRTDGLTLLPNRQHWEQVASTELRRHGRSGRPAVLMMIDIDHFKAINDRHGHLVGDEVIRRFASDLRASLRDIDTAGRYGGDEFAVVMPETGPEGAEQAARRLMMHVRRRAAAGELPAPYSISIGFALATRDMADCAAWIAAADAALYRAKADGRDRASA